MMSKGIQKKQTERRKRPRKAKSSRPSKAAPKVETKSSKKPAVSSETEACYSCSKDLKGHERALFVEEEIGRIFCSEECIATYFTPEIDRLEKEYFKFLSPNDLSATEREKFSHLRWITLQEPDEVWRQKTLSGDYRYTLISEFNPTNKPIWCVCICLFLRGEPSFLYLAFPTKNAAMVNHYRRGERVEWVKPPAQPNRIAPNTQESAPATDGLADSWTDAETLRAEVNQFRREDDIPESEFPLYESCLEETLEAPDELWTIESEEEFRVYHFIRYYPEEQPGSWFVIVARETDDPEQLEILDSFPTKDSELVERFRHGRQELGEKDNTSPSRLVH